MTFRENALALCALLVAGQAGAAFNEIIVQFSPNAAQFTEGEQVAVTAGTNGANVEYQFVLETTGASPVRVARREWSSSNTFQVDTGAANVPPGTYVLKVIARESANKQETLTRVDRITVLESQEPACDTVEGRTYTNRTGATFGIGTQSLDMLYDGLALSLPEDVQAISAVHFGSGGNLVLELERLTACYTLFMGCPYDHVDVGATVSGTYTCANNVITVNAAQAVDLSDSGPAETTLGDIPYVISIGGTLDIKPYRDTLVSGTATFDNTTE